MCKCLINMIPAVVFLIISLESLFSKSTVLLSKKMAAFS